MARINATKAMLHASTAEGHAKAIAPNSYLEKVAEEPSIQRIVPFIIMIFLVAVWSGTIFKLANDKREVMAAALVDLDNIASLTAIDLQIAINQTHLDNHDISRKLLMSLPSHAVEGGRQVYVTSQTGAVIAASPRQHMAKTLDDILGNSQPLTALADRAGVLRITTPSGEDVIATVRSLDDRKSQIAFLQPVSAILSPWYGRLLSMIVLMGATTLVISALAIAFHQQASRAREADLICLEMRRRVEMVLTSGDSGLWDWDISRGRVFWSDSMFALLGQSRKDEFLSFADIAAMVHPEDANLFQAADQLVQNGDAKIDSEFRLRHADGRWIWMRARGKTIIDPAAKTAHLVGIAVDITEQKAAMEASATADMRVRDAIEAITEAFALYDSQDQLVAANSKYRNLHGLSADLTAPGTSRQNILEASGKQNIVYQDIIKACAVTGSRSYEMRLADGRWFHVNERPTKDGGYVTVSSDISAHKAYEQSLATTNEMLELMVADLERSKAALQNKTRRLVELNDQYLLQKAEAETANLAKSEFLSNMSHELRTPLNHIINFADMMDAAMFGPLGSDRYETYVKDISKSGNYLLAVITDILEMSSLEAGQVTLERERVSLAELIEEARTKHSLAAKLRSTEILIRAEGPLHVIGDRKKLFIIIDNMLRNAVKYTSQGGKVGLRAKRSGDAVHLFFEDNGAGIPDDMLEKMGRPFEQNGSVMEDGYKGSGLGFSIAKSLSELHGGTIRIRSKIGAGTIMMVSLPVDGVASSLREQDAA